MMRDAGVIKPRLRKVGQKLFKARSRNFQIIFQLFQPMPPD
jgi:hypothetical protein